MYYNIEIKDGFWRMNKKLNKLFFLPIACLLLASCGRIDLYEKQAPIPSQKWFYNDVPEFTFQIEDTTSHYNIYVVLRHTDLYNYNNIWVRIGSKSPNDSTTYQNINLKLATAQGWEGTGMDDIFEVRKLISPGPVTFKRSGEYHFSIAQIMRENPLEHIMNVGIRVEKVSM